MGAEKLVSVVIPAYNAEATLDETLQSVRGQTHRTLEIVVVDDGSTDGTAALAQTHAAEDPRVRVLSVANGGVASARNAGIAATRGAFVAPVDADDLWHPEKISRQLAVVERDPEIGFVYTLYRTIDGQSRVTNSLGHVMEGRVFLRLLLNNAVGNGSSLLIRRAALEEVGGYEPDLRRQNAQGCEDYLLQVLLARRWKVACVPEYLTGYRYGAAGMSTDWERMARSHRLMLEHVMRRHPETPADVVAASDAVNHAALAVRRLRRLRPLASAAELRCGLRLDADAATRMARGYAWATLRGMVTRRFARIGIGAGQGPHFLDVDPAEGPRRPERALLADRVAAMADRDEAFPPPPPAAPAARAAGASA